MSFKIKLNTDDIASTIKSQTKEILQKKHYDVECPHCGKSFQATSGANTCPHCNGNVTLNLNIKL